MKRFILPFLLAFAVTLAEAKGGSGYSTSRSSSYSSSRSYSSPSRSTPSYSSPSRSTPSYTTSRQNSSPAPSRSMPNSTPAPSTSRSWFSRSTTTSQPRVVYKTVYATRPAPSYWDHGYYRPYYQPMPYYGWDYYGQHRSSFWTPFLVGGGLGYLMFHDSHGNQLSQAQAATAAQKCEKVSDDSFQALFADNVFSPEDWTAWEKIVADCVSKQ